MGRMYTPGKVGFLSQVAAKKKKISQKKKKKLRCCALGHFQICPPVPPHAGVVGETVGEGCE
jgi:hypothetical protein